jgi:hypothetical protein
MKVRFRFGEGRRVSRRRGKNRRLAAAAAALLVPIALMAYVMGLWRLASDLGLAGEFALEGIFSHWQVWIASGLALSLAASALNRYGHGGAEEESRAPAPIPHRAPEPERPPMARKAGSRP